MKLKGIILWAVEAHVVFCTILHSCKKFTFQTVTFFILWGFYLLPCLFLVFCITVWSRPIRKFVLRTAGSSRILGCYVAMAVWWLSGGSTPQACGYSQFIWIKFQVFVCIGIPLHSYTVCKFLSVCIIYVKYVFCYFILLFLYCLQEIVSFL